MYLVSSRESEIAAARRWEDVALLLHVCEYAQQHDVMGDANAWGLGIGVLQATGMAAWASTVTEESYTWSSAAISCRSARRRAGRRRRAALRAGGAA